MRRPWLPLVSLLLAACTGPPPLPEGPRRTPAETLAALRARGAQVHSLYGVIVIAYDGPDRRGTFDAIVHWEAPGRLRLTAYKDLLVVAPDVFDLLLTPEEWALAARPDGPQDEVRARRRGRREDLPAAEPRFAAVHWVGEGLFLPGALSGPAEVLEAEVLEDGERQRVRTRLASGAQAEWLIDPRTLAISEGTVTGGDGRWIGLRFSGWRADEAEAGQGAGGVLFPEQVELSDPAGQTRMTIRLREHELNPALDPAVFAPRSVLEAE